MDSGGTPEGALRDPSISAERKQSLKEPPAFKLARNVQELLNRLQRGVRQLAIQDGDLAIIILLLGLDDLAQGHRPRERCPSPERQAPQVLQAEVLGFVPHVGLDLQGVHRTATTRLTSVSEPLASSW